MFAARVVVKGKLKLLTPLHLGTGEVASYDSIRHDDPESGEAVSTRVATVMRDVLGMPVIPGASVKGVLRSLVADHAGAEVLFGSKAGADELHQGRLTAHALRYAASNDPAKLAGNLPFHARAMPDGPSLVQRGLFIAARTAIDPGTGTADDQKLFHQEMVAPDAEFSLHLSMRLDPPLASAEAEECLIEALSRLTAEDGVAFGKGQSLGQGRLRLDPASLKVERLTVDTKSGKLEAKDDPALAARIGKATGAGASCRIVLKLTGDGPFLVDDTSIKPEKKSEKPRLNAQHRDGKPHLPGSTLAGALRARAAWLSRLRWNDGRDGENRERILALKDEAAAKADPARVVTEPANLTPTERLFGVTGWRSLVRIARVDCKTFAGFENITSVKLDRFSMAPIDGALFTTRAAIDPVFEAVLEIEKRGGFPSSDDNELLAALLEDLQNEGLTLGHGTSRGYGWFGVGASEEQPATGGHQ